MEMDRDDSESSDDDSIGSAIDLLPPMPDDIMENSEQETDSEEEELYDISLAATHSYMSGLEPVSRRWVLEAGWVGRLPVMSHHGVVFPGETVPLLLPPTRNAVLLSQTAQAIKQDRLFGLLCPDASGSGVSGYGVLCEVFEASVADDDEPTVAFKARAVHRFRLNDAPTRALPMHDFDRMRLVELTVLPELASSDSLRSACDHSLAPLVSVVTPATPAPPRAALWGGPGGLGGPGSCGAGGERGAGARLARRLEAASTPWPLFVHDVLDYRRMRTQLHEYFKTIMLDKMPEDPVTLSFWVASNMALSMRDRLTLFTVDNALLRLRLACRLTRRKSVLCCSACMAEIARREHIFPMSSEGVHANYVNLGGYMHDLLTVSHTGNVALSGAPSAEYSWFPGYSWTIATCARCHAHVGWRFEALKGSLRPQHFHGLCRNNLQPRAARRSAPPRSDQSTPATTPSPTPAPTA